MLAPMGAVQILMLHYLWRQFSGFIGNFDTGIPQYAYRYQC